MSIATITVDTARFNTQTSIIRKLNTSKVSGMVRASEMPIGKIWQAMRLL